MANRIWIHHFGVGLVATPDNFGVAGQPPTHPRLLDWLAAELMSRDWSIKSIHRVILLSRCYQQSSQASDDASARDPENTLYSRMPLRRLDAEVLRDNLLWLCDRLDLRPYGPGDPVEARPDGLVTSRPTDGRWRRSIYVVQRRSQIPTLLENFDLPRMSPNCVQRRLANVAPQALQLLNDGFVNQLAHQTAERLSESELANSDAQITRLYMMAFCRKPDSDELRMCREQLDRFAAAWEQDANISAMEASKRALGNLCRVVMNSAEFLYID